MCVCDVWMSLMTVSFSLSSLSLPVSSQSRSHDNELLLEIFSHSNHHQRNPSVCVMGAAVVVVV